jgi:hypothetical protein
MPDSSKRQENIRIPCTSDSAMMSSEKYKRGARNLN